MCLQTLALTRRWCEHRVRGNPGRSPPRTLARLYGSRLVRVVRGARADRGRVVEAWTLISPYPSADLRTLHPGTMRLILKVAP